MRLRGYPTFRQTPMAAYMTTIDSSSTGLYSTCAWVTWVNYIEPTPEVVQLLCSKHLVPLKFIRTYILFRIDPKNSWGRTVIDQNDDPFQLGELQTVRGASILPGLFVHFRGLKGLDALTSRHGVLNGCFEHPNGDPKLGNIMGRWLHRADLFLLDNTRQCLGFMLRIPMGKASICSS